MYEVRLQRGKTWVEFGPKFKKIVSLRYHIGLTLLLKVILVTRFLLLSVLGRLIIELSLLTNRLTCFSKIILNVLLDALEIAGLSTTTCSSS